MILIINVDECLLRRIRREDFLYAHKTLFIMSFRQLSTHTRVPHTNSRYLPIPIYFINPDFLDIILQLIYFTDLYERQRHII